MFKQVSKRWHPNQKTGVDDAAVDIVRDPTIGETKKGDLAGVFVHKFKCSGQPTLLAYEPGYPQHAGITYSSLSGIKPGIALPASLQ